MALTLTYWSKRNT